jgi:hypothetical protein
MSKVSPREHKYSLYEFASATRSAESGSLLRDSITILIKKSNE